MKQISGICVSSNQTSLSKAAKIMSNFVSAENGASQAINAYLHRTSYAFNELNQLHKELRSSNSHRKKHKRNRAEDDENGRGFEIIQGLNHHDEKSTQTDVKFSEEERDGSIGDHKKHKKHKRKNQEI